MARDSAQALKDYHVPEHLHDGLALYLEHGIPPGSFLTAVLENNLVEALGRADENSRRGLFQLASFMYNAMPSDSWGSPEKVAKYIQARRANAEVSK